MACSGCSTGLLVFSEYYTLVNVFIFCCVILFNGTNVLQHIEASMCFIIHKRGQSLQCCNELIQTSSFEPNSRNEVVIKFGVSIIKL